MTLMAGVFWLIRGSRVSRILFLTLLIITAMAGATFVVSLALMEHHNPIVACVNPSADPVLRHDFLVQLDAQTRFFGHRNVAVNYRK